MKVFIAAALACIVQSGDTLTEELKIWRFTDQLSLMSFQFNFDLTDQSEDRMLDYFPAQFYELI